MAIFSLLVSIVSLIFSILISIDNPIHIKIKNYFSMMILRKNFRDYYNSYKHVGTYFDKINKKAFVETDSELYFFLTILFKNPEPSVSEIFGEKDNEETNMFEKQDITKNMTMFTNFLYDCNFMVYFSNIPELKSKIIQLINTSNFKYSNCPLIDCINYESILETFYNINSHPSEKKHYNYLYLELIICKSVFNKKEQKKIFFKILNNYTKENISEESIKELFDNTLIKKDLNSIVYELYYLNNKRNHIFLKRTMLETIIRLKGDSILNNIGFIKDNLNYINYGYKEEIAEAYTSSLLSIKIGMLFQNEDFKNLDKENIKIFLKYNPISITHPNNSDFLNVILVINHMQNYFEKYTEYESLCGLRIPKMYTDMFNVELTNDYVERLKENTL